MQSPLACLLRLLLCRLLMEEDEEILTLDFQLDPGVNDSDSRESTDTSTNSGSGSKIS
jgi:hypothetical protein